MRRCPFLLFLFFSLFAKASTPADLRVCNAILREVASRGNEVDEAQQRAAALFSQDPLNRALAISTMGTLGQQMSPVRLQPGYSFVYRGQEIFIPASVIAYDGKAGKAHHGLRLWPDADLNTLKVANVRDVDRDQPTLVALAPSETSTEMYPFKPHAGTEVVASWFSGHTAAFSHVARVYRPLKVASSPAPDQSPHHILQSIYRSNWVDVAGVTADIPFHGSGWIPPHPLGLKEALDWRERYFSSLNKFGVPVSGNCRSAENLFLAAAVYRNPTLISGMIWESPLHPVEGFVESLAGYRDDIFKYNAPINNAALKHLIDSRLAMLQDPSLHWWKAASWPVPTLILVGGSDRQVSEKTKEALKGFARRFPKTVFYVEIPASGHDLFAVSGESQGTGENAGFSRQAKNRAEAAWQYVFWFWRKHILHDQKARTPEYGYLLVN